MKNKKITFILLTLIMIMIIGNANTVYAETYNITLDGVDYVCESKYRSAGQGFPKNQYPSSEQARIECENNQKNYIDSARHIHIFDNPSACKFEETADFYDCNCNATVYSGCKKVNIRQDPTYSEKRTIEVKFMTESNTVLYERTCEITGSIPYSYCQITFPKYACGNNKTFNGWVSKKNGNCNNAIASGELKYLGSSGRVHTYWIYYPCCDASGITNNTPANTIPTVTPNVTPYTHLSTSTPSISENNSSASIDNNANDNPTVNQTPINEIDNTNQNNKASKDEDNKADNKSNSLLIILIIVILVLIVITIVLAILRKKNSSNNYNNSNDDDTFNSNNYYS